jgi:hypothetical protein
VRTARREPGKKQEVARRQYLVHNRQTVANIIDGKNHNQSTRGDDMGSAIWRRQEMQRSTFGIQPPHRRPRAYLKSDIGSLSILRAFITEKTDHRLFQQGIVGRNVRLISQFSVGPTGRSAQSQKVITSYPYYYSSVAGLAVDYGTDVIQLRDLNTLAIVANNLSNTEETISALTSEQHLGSAYSFAKQDPGISEVDLSSSALDSDALGVVDSGIGGIDDDSSGHGEPEARHDDSGLNGEP